MNSAASSVMVLSRSRPLIRPTTIMDVAMVWRRAVFGHRFRRRSRRRPCPPISGPSHRPCLIRTSRRARGLFLPPSSRYPRLGPQALAQQRPRSSRQRRLSRQPLPREPSRKAPRLNRWLLRPRPPRAANRCLRPSRFRRIPPHRPRSCQRRRLSRQLLLREPSRKATRRRPCQSSRNPLLSSTHRRLRQLSAHHRRLRRPFMRRRLRKPFTRLHPRPRPAARRHVASPAYRPARNRRQGIRTANLSLMRT